MILLFLIWTTGFEYLSVDPIAGRGSMGYALSGDGYSLNYNPAGLALNEINHYSISYLNYICNTHFGYLGLEKKQLGLGIKYFYSGRIKKTDAMGNEYGYFGTNFIDLNIGQGFFLKNFIIGASLKLVYENIDSLSSFGLGCDIGGLYIFPVEKIQTGFTIKNIGTALKPFIEEKEIFPYEIDLAIAKQFNNGWFGIDLVKQSLTNFGIRLGGRYDINPIFCVIASYTSLLSQIKMQSGLDFLAGLNIGFAIKKSPIAINYVYAPYFTLGQGHKITIKLGG
uniref:PorV/PorQ family protein n=1 Tax=candidate division WOR-3 bacterium TaxID=2052148 RepID=A0A7C4TCN5_UNCW3